MSKISVRDILRYVLAYVLWVITMAVGMLGILQLRNAINILWPALGGSRWTLRAVDRFGFVLLSLGWLIFAILTEYHYRTSVNATRRRRTTTVPVGGGGRLRRLGLDLLLPRFARDMILPVGVLVLAYVTQKVAFALLAR